MSKSQLNIVVSLFCEAKPIIDFYHLKKDVSCQEFDVFVSKQKNIYLIVSGVGKLLSATATSYLHNVSKAKKNSIYINLGIAAHKEFQIGEMILANKITDLDNGKNFYPSNLLNLGLKESSLITFGMPQKILPNALVDMEASGFYMASNVFVTNEFIQVIKIISDNGYEQKLKPSFVTDLISRQMQNIKLLISRMLHFSELEFDKNLDYNKLLKKHHFTFSEEHKLLNLLKRCNALNIEIKDANNKKELFANMEADLKSFNVIYD